MVFCLWLIHLTDMFGDGAVGEQHELLDELGSIVRFLEVCADGLSLVVDIEV